MQIAAADGRRQLRLIFPRQQQRRLADVAEKAALHQDRRALGVGHDVDVAADGLRRLLVPCVHRLIQRLLDSRRSVPLGPAAMETLTVIAYNQPVSRAFIEQVRGVDSSSSVSGLLEKGLIEEAGRLDLPGRPVSFRTTDTFLRVFGLSSLADLPPVHGAEAKNDTASKESEG